MDQPSQGQGCQGTIDCISPTKNLGILTIFFLNSSLSPKSVIAGEPRLPVGKCREREALLAGGVIVREEMSMFSVAGSHDKEWGHWRHTAEYKSFKIPQEEQKNLLISQIQNVSFRM
jgi:hypothetical protein